MVYWKVGCWVKEQRGRRRIQLIDDLFEMKNYTDFKKAAEDQRLENNKKKLS